MKDTGVDTLLREADDAPKVDADEDVGCTCVNEDVVNGVEDGTSSAHGVPATYD
jgi:hypothetical protein